MSERACQAIITGSKTEKEMNILWTGGLFGAFMGIKRCSVFEKERYDYVAPGFTNQKMDINMSSGLLEH